MAEPLELTGGQAKAPGDIRYGQRRGEVVGMCRAELSGLDGDKPVWDIPSDRAMSTTVTLSGPNCRNCVRAASMMRRGVSAERTFRAEGSNGEGMLPVL